MKKVVIIGKCSKNKPSGPSSIIRGLVNALIRNEVDVDTILLDEDTGKIKILKDIFYKVMKTKGVAVNVHTEGFLIPLIIYICSLFNRRNKYFLTVHGVYRIDAKYKGKNKLFYVALERFLYSHFPNLICVSEMLKDDISKIFERKQNIYVIPNATDACDFEKCGNKKHRQSSQLKIIMLGGLRRQKGLFNVLNIMDFLYWEKKVDVHCDIYGSIDNEETKNNFLNSVREKNLESIVVYKGMINDKTELYSIIKKADFQLCVSYYDTFNVAIAESLVLGCPCITSNKCGASYLISEDCNGIIVELDKNYNEDIYEFIDSFRKNPAKYELVSKEAEFVKMQVSWSGVAKQYIRIFE